MSIKCFWLEPTEKEKRYLRRYVSSEESKCSSSDGYHDARTFLDESREVMDMEKGCWVDSGQSAEDFKNHPLWPTHCGCGYEFKESDQRQLFGQHLYRRVDTGEEMTLQDAPEGAMWDAMWMHDWKDWCGDDGRSLVCKVPTNYDWCMDSRASNCTRPNEPHKCWVRHGKPPELTVDKLGNTCSAGAGSIVTPTWHGFLRNGYLVSC